MLLLRKILLVSSFLLFSATALGANGLHAIGVSSHSLGMGGTGVGAFTGVTEALFRNPALLNQTRTQNGEVQLEAGAFFARLNSKANGGAGDRENQSGGRFTPAVAASYRLQEDLSLGLGLEGFGGGEFDYTGHAEINQLKTNLELARVLAGVSYAVSEKVTLGLAPFLAYGALSLNESARTLIGDPAQSGRKRHYAFGVGVQLGLLWKAMEQLHFGLAYTSPSNIRYPDTVDIDLFGPQIGTRREIDALEVTNPGEWAGAVAAFLGDWTLALDLRWIRWSQANLYQELGWKNQVVLAFGAQYQLDPIALRFGYNYGASPVKSEAGQNGLGQQALQGHTLFTQSVSVFNVASAAGYSEHHLCLGAGYPFTDRVALDLSFVLSPKASISRTGTGTNPLTGSAGDYSYTGSMTQWALGLTASFIL